MDKLKQIMRLCKCSVSINIDEHKDYYETVEEYVIQQKREEIPQEIWDKMVENNTCIEIHAYPNTPISFHSVYHYDLDAALDNMIKLIKE